MPDTPTTRQRAYLSFYEATEAGPGLVPDEITEIVGLQPTEAHRRGDPATGRPWPRHRSSAWRYEQPAAATYDTEDVVRRLLDAIEPHADGIRAACRTLGLGARAEVVIEMHATRKNTYDDALVVTTPAISYSAETVARLAALDLSIDHDQYVFLGD
ncbi:MULTISPECIES: DUF4279 domain-containing protein [Catenuloplanes]|uniref:DUF4279 domain-containing protein n=1 Tax=Catenuloplanes niger TaxID=587534 RepID=A0AAE3ZRK0_9ACTN|nr:DUF4279 domain-containing protein [Catenuloplanes niger]MDR7324768.1 hypothetical protein [Catenuloplanes niger]